MSAKEIKRVNFIQPVHLTVKRSLTPERAVRAVDVELLELKGNWVYITAHNIQYMVHTSNIQSIVLENDGS